ncbi:MAG: hypothetical protein M3133_10465, partial [Actinomycetota bacterium]|nr:hypothetical protein [Actinomycetota bacterium]
YGMGTGLHSRRLAADDYSMSDATRRLLDDEQQHITDLAYRRAQGLILANRPLLDELAATLLAKEVLERADIDRIVAGARPPEPLTRPAGEVAIAAAKRLDQPADGRRPS